jgi:hypothetical protein
MPGLVPLQPINPEERGSTLCPVGSLLALRGSDPTGTTFVCGHCTKFTLAKDIGPLQIWELDFRCPHCGGFSRSPLLPKGTPLPGGTTISIARGDYRCETTIELAINVVIAGASAIESRAALSGWGRPTPPGGAPPKVLDYELASGYLRRLEGLLGSSYKRQVKLAERYSRKGFSTPRKSRLAELISHGMQTATALKNGEGKVLWDFGELITVTETLERWRSDPAFPRLVNGLLTRHEYLHSLTILIAISQLTDLGNGVGLYQGREEGQSVPDFWIQTTAINRLDVEVKTAEELRFPSSPLTRAAAQVALEKARKESLKGRRPQLAAPTPSILLLGGMSLTEADMDTLESVCRDCLSSTGSNYSHLAGILLFSFQLLVEPAPDPSGKGSFIGTNIAGGAKIRLVKNPQYGGVININYSEVAAGSFSGIAWKE